MSNITNPQIPTLVKDGTSKNTSSSKKPKKDPKEAQEKRKPNPLPYVITFLILFLVALGVLTWVLDGYNKVHKCSTFPNIWCWNDFQCQNPCSKQPCTTGSTEQCAFSNIPPGITGAIQSAPVSNCFLSPNSSTGPTGGLASCLIGPDSTTSTLCVPNTGVTGTNNLSCNCVAPVQNITSNCYSGCSQNLRQLASQGTTQAVAACKSSQVSS